MARTTERRRASEEYGGRKPRKPERPHTPWQRHMRRHHAVWKATRRHYRRHKHKRGAFAAAVGVLGLSVLGGMWIFQGTTSLLTGVVCVGAVAGGYTLHKRDEAKVMQGTRRASSADKLRFATGNREPYRRPEPAAEEAPETGRIRVRSHRRDGDGVESHTRARPGAAKAANAPGGAWSPNDGKVRHPKAGQLSGRVLHGSNPNSNEGPDELRAQGKCGDCGGRGFWNSFGTPGTYRHTHCPTCGA